MKKFCFLILVLFFSASTAQVKDYYVAEIDTLVITAEDRGLLDSILPLVHQAKADTVKLDLLAQIVEKNGNDAIWPRYNQYLYDRSSFLARRSSGPIRSRYRKYMADAVNNFGFISINKGDVEKAVRFFQEALVLQRDLNDSSGIAATFNNLGYVHKSRGEIAKALEHYSEALKIYEKKKHQVGAANCLNNIGLIYKSQGETGKAIEYYNRSVSIWKKIGDSDKIAACYNNLGFVFNQKGDTAKALEYYRKTLELDRKNRNKHGIANTLNNIGLIYDKYGKDEDALALYREGLTLYQEVEDKEGISGVLVNIGKILLERKALGDALHVGKQAHNLALELGYPDLISSSSHLLADTYREVKNWQRAFEMHELYMRMRDSIFNQETQRAAIKQQMNYQYEKEKALAEILHQKQQLVIKEEKKRQRIINIASGAGIIVLISFGGFIFNRYRVSNRQKQVIELQKEQVDLAYQQVTEKNREILDSIHYARRIQSAILKEEEHVSMHLPEHFILFKPKDIVSGDFYWSYEKNGFWYVAAGDCTGHGVPGAFLTMLSTAFLNELVSSRESITPASLLDELRDKVVKEFSRQSQGESEKLINDGLDISLLRLELSSGCVRWAGANNPLWIYRSSNELDEYPADKQPIGHYPNSRPFTDHSITIGAGDTLYLFTDGYSDQFGGERGKKFKPKNLQELLRSMQQLPLKRQKEELVKHFENWRDGYEQLDDVCIIGIRV